MKIYGVCAAQVKELDDAKRTLSQKLHESERKLHEAVTNLEDQQLEFKISKRRSVRCPRRAGVTSSRGATGVCRAKW
jgi:hypothetical protein